VNCALVKFGECCDYMNCVEMCIRWCLLFLVMLIYLVNLFDDNYSDNSNEVRIIYELVIPLIMMISLPKP